MPRKEKTVFKLLCEQPWWLNVCFSAAVYVLLAFALPALHVENPAAKGLVQGLNNLAPVFAFLFLIPAFISARNAWRKRKP